MAPEIIVEPINYSSKVDIWALGIILYSLVSSSFPFELDNHYKLMKSIKDEEPKPLPPSTSTYIKQLISMLLDKNPETRPSAE